MSVKIAVVETEMQDTIGARLAFCMCDRAVNTIYYSCWETISDRHKDKELSVIALKHMIDKRDDQRSPSIIWLIKDAITDRHEALLFAWMARRAFARLLHSCVPSDAAGKFHGA